MSALKIEKAAVAVVHNYSLIEILTTSYPSALKNVHFMTSTEHILVATLNEIHAPLMFSL